MYTPRFSFLPRIIIVALLAGIGFGFMTVNPTEASLGRRLTGDQVVRLQAANPAAGIEDAQDDVIQGTRASDGTCRFSFRHPVGASGPGNEVRMTAIDKSTCQAEVVTGIPAALPTPRVSSSNATTHHYHRDVAPTGQGLLAPAKRSGPQQLSTGRPDGDSHGALAQSGQYPVTEYVVWNDPFNIAVNEMFVAVRAYYDGYSVYALDCADYENYADTGWYIDWNYATYDCNTDSNAAFYSVNMHFENDTFCGGATTDTYYVDETAYSDPGDGNITGWINSTWSDGPCTWLLDESDYPAEWEFEMAPSRMAYLPANGGSR